MLYRFGDLGTGKTGLSLNHSSTAVTSGFAPMPFSGGGADAISQNTLGEFASFATGQEFSALRDTVTLNGSQSQSSGSYGGGSSRDIANNRLDYAINTDLSVYGTIGWEYINYGGGNHLNIDDMTWSFGTTWTPNPDSTVTIGYGHQNGANSLTFSGHYALTARTMLTGSYTNGVGTQLEQVSNQLDNGAVNNNGNTVNSQTGGPLFVGNNALGVAPGRVPLQHADPEFGDRAGPRHDHLHCVIFIGDSGRHRPSFQHQHRPHGVGSLVSPVHPQSRDEYQPILQHRDADRDPGEHALARSAPVFAVYSQRHRLYVRQLQLLRP